MSCGGPVGDWRGLVTGYMASGQKGCADGAGRPIACPGSGQDAEYRRGIPWPSPRFWVMGPVVQDRLTGLDWSRHAGLAEFPLTWPEALGFIGQMNGVCALGHADWRLPNRRELRSLISHETRRPALPAGHPFTDVFNGWYWSSTTAAMAPAYAWYVSMDGGRMFFGGKDQSFMVWPVRGTSRVLPVTGQTHCYADSGVIECAGTRQDGEMRMGAGWPHPRFVCNGDVVVDRLTRLRWKMVADAAGTAVDWMEALATVRRLNGGPERGWRLPNINELESLVDCDSHHPALPRAHPFRSVREVYWSSTTSMFEPDWAWALYLDSGGIGVGQKTQARFWVWAVSDAFPDE